MLSAGELLAFGGAAAAVACIGVNATQRKMRSVQIGRRLLHVAGDYDGPAGDGFWGHVGTAVGQKTMRRRSEVQELSTVLRSAGFYAASAPYIFASVQLATSAVASVLAVAWALAANAPIRTIVIDTITGVSAGYILPRLALSFLAKGQRRRIHQELPLLIDMLLLLLRSGMGVERGFREIERFGAEAVPTIHPTLTLLLADLDQGRDYDDALMRWAERMSDPAAVEVARHLRQSLTHGTGVAKALSAFAHRFVEQRLSAARETAGRRSSFVTLVTVSLFLPPLLIVLAAPAFSQLTRLFTHH